MIEVNQTPGFFDDPIFTLQPISRTIASGTTVAFPAAATSTKPLTYQWFKNCIPIPGATNSTYTIVNAQSSDVGAYSVQARRSTGFTTSSDTAFLEIGPDSGARTFGKLAELFDFATASGTGPGAPPPNRQVASLRKAAFPVVSAGSVGTQIFNNHASTTQSGEPNHCNVIGGASRWFRLTAGASAAFVVDTIGSDIDTVLAVYTGTSLFDLQQVACDDNSAPDGRRSKVTFNAAAGTHYLIAVDGLGGTQGNIKLNWMMGTPTTVPPSMTLQPTNQTVLTLTDVTLAASAGGTSPLYYQWRKGGSDVPGANNPSLTIASVGTNDSGTYQLVVTNTQGSITSSAAVLTVLRRQAMLMWTNPAAIGYGTILGTTQLNATASLPGALVYNPGAGSLLNAGTQTLNVGFTPTDPTNYITANASVLISVTRAPLTIQAHDKSRLFGQPNPALTVGYSGFVNGETNNVLTAQPVVATMAIPGSPIGNYPITVSGASASNYSITHIGGTLNVFAEGLQITNQPTNLTVVVGDPASFSVGVDGTAPFAYQWYFNETNAIAGGTNANLNLTNVQSAAAGSYLVIVTNVVGGVTSSAPTLTVLVPPSITLQPTNEVANALQSVILTAAADGTAPLYYQWRKNGAPILGATATTLTLNNVTTNAAASYTLVVTNTVGSTTSSPAVLTVNQLNSFITWTNPLAIGYGSPITPAQLNAIANVPGGYTYSPTNGTRLPAGSHTLQVSFAPNDSGNYLPANASVTAIVAQASLTIRALNQTRLFNQPNPALTVSYTGFVNGESNNVFTTQPVVSTTALLTSSPGDYPISVSGAAASNYSITHIDGTLTVSAENVAITNQPASVTAIAGTAADFTVGVSGTAPFAYQWYFNGTNLLAGLTNAALNLANVQSINAGGYSVIITNIAGSITSSVATLSVLLPPTMVQQPTNQTINALQSVTLNGLAAGTPPLSYEWRKNGVPIAGANNAALTLNNVTTNAAGTYVLIVTNNAGSVTGAPVVLTVNQLTSTMTWMNPVAIGYGTPIGSVQLNANANVPGGFTYSPTNGTLLPAGNHTLQVSFAPNDSGNYLPANASVPLVVTPAPLTIRALNQTRLFGQANPALTVSYIGFVNGESNNVFTTQPVVSTTALLTSSPGDYPISVSGAAASNYSITHIDGTLTIFAENLAITNQPVDLSVTAGSTAAFTVGVNGTAPFAYQWYFNQTNLLTGATNTALNLTNVQPILAGGYSVVITNIAGSVTSSVAALTVLVPPSIALQPTSQVVSALQNITLTAVANGTAPLHHQWRKNGAPIPGATAATLSLNNVTTNAAATYTLVVTNAVGSITSAPAILTVSQLNSFIIWTDPVAIGYGAPIGSVQLNAIANVPGGFTYSPTNGTRLPAGSHTLQVSFAPNDSGNYLPANASVPLVVTQAPLTIRALNQTRLFGQTNPILAVTYTGFVNGDTNNALTTQPAVTTSALVGSQPGDYLISVSGATASNYAITHINGTLTVFAENLAITNQPANSIVVAGSPATFNVGVSGTAPFSYQWLFNGTNLLNSATNATLNLTNAQPVHAGGYSVIITNVAGSITSSVAVLTVQIPPSIVLQPTSRIAAIGSTVELQVSATGSPPPTYQWYRNQLPVSGAVSSLLSIPNIQPAQAGNYHVVAANAAGSATSAVANVTVVAPVIITLHPTNERAIAGGSVTLRVEADGAPPLFVQWHRNNQQLTDATNFDLSLSGVTRAHEGAYHARVTNAIGSALSSNAFVRVLVPPRLRSVQVLPGGQFRLHFLDHDGNPLTAGLSSNYVIEVSADLQTWTAISTNGSGLNLTNGEFRFDDAGATGVSRRYYRIYER